MAYSFRDAKRQSTSLRKESKIMNLVKRTSDPLAVLGLKRQGNVGAFNIAALNPQALAALSAHLQAASGRPSMPGLSIPTSTMAAAIARPMGSGAIQGGGNRGRRCIALGVASTTAGGILAGNSETINVESNVGIDLQDFRVMDSIADAFVVEDIRVNRTSILAGSVGIPADNFTSAAVTPLLDLGVLPSGAQIIVEVTNVSLATAAFYAAFYGLPC